MAKNGFNLTTDGDVSGDTGFGLDAFDLYPDAHHSGQKATGHYTLGIADRLKEIVSDKEWKRYAECQYHDPDLWFPEISTDAYEQAREICNKCPVINECLEQALSDKNHEGMWGGKTPNERKRILKERKSKC